MEDTITTSGTTVGPTRVTSAVDAAVARHRQDRGPLLPVLHSVQADLGWLPPEATGLVAKALNLSRAEVHGVITFYSDFRDHPPARRTIRICGAEACQARGSRELTAHAAARLGGVADTALESVLCLGNCALGPAVEIDGTLHGRVDAARFDVLVEEGR